ncbi:hypothetical protein [Mycoplasmopsis pullorum]|uniref:hypothetical protein n=1 Tax=Mycoplasmopsis pullorum TaxID=48003 RepID=UPI00111B905A|nr:hypothetical protein [Mycoplasmopsis pullorum]
MSKNKIDYLFLLIRTTQIGNLTRKDTLKALSHLIYDSLPLKFETLKLIYQILKSKLITDKKTKNDRFEKFITKLAVYYLLILIKQ